MAFWGRVWRINNVVSLADCYNVTSPDQVQGSASNLISDVPVSVSSVAGAVDYWLEQLRTRLSCKLIVTSGSDTVFNVQVRRGTREDTMVWYVTNNKGKYPVRITYTTPVTSGDAMFYNMYHAIDWLVQSLA